MSEELRTKEDVSLYDLRCALQRVDAWRATIHKEPTIEAERDAWRTAFKWLKTHHGPFGCDDYDEGMALIREKLQS